jgi:hypothetical protein
MNAFDKIAQKAPASPSKKSTKIAAVVDDAIKVAVDRVIQIKGQIKLLEQEQGDKETLIIDAVRPQQDAAAREGNYSKSFDVPGNDGALVLTTADSFSVPKDAATLEAVKKTIGQKKYDEFIKNKRVVAVKPTVVADDKLVDKIMAVLDKAGIENIFEVTDTPVACEDLDRKQYDLTQDKLDIFRTLVRQKKASLKY